MKVLLVTAITALALPFMAFGQGEKEQQQPPQQGQEQANKPANAPETTAPAKGKKKTASAQEQATPQAKTETHTGKHGQAAAQPGHNESKKDAAAGADTGASTQTNLKGGNRTVNKQEFRSQHTEVFNLGVHPKEFFVQRYGENHFRVFGNVYYVFVDTCWVSVHVDGFGYTENVICPGDAEFVEVE